MIKRILTMTLLLIMLNAGAFAESNSFMDDMKNASGHDMSFMLEGEYVYWLEYVTDGWEEKPGNICRMKPGDAQAQRFFTGEYDFWICSMKNIGGRMILGVKESYNSDTLYPWLMDFNGENLQRIPGRMDSWLVAEGAIYNCIDNRLFRLPVDTLESTQLYSFSEDYKDISLRQYADGKIYFQANNDSVYELNLSTFEERLIYYGRSSFVVQEGYMYLCDLENGNGCWRIDLSTGAKIQVSDKEYIFEQGLNGYVLARGQGESNYYEGSVFDLSAPVDSLETMRAGDYDPYYEFFLGGMLMRYDSQTNTVEYSNRTFVRQNDLKEEVLPAETAISQETVAAEGVSAFARGGTIIMRFKDEWLSTLEKEKVSIGRTGVYAMDEIENVLAKLLTPEALEAYGNDGYIKAAVYMPTVKPANGSALFMNKRHIGDSWYMVIRPDTGVGTAWDMYLSVAQYNIEISQFSNTSVLPELSEMETGSLGKKYTAAIKDRNGLSSDFKYTGKNFSVAVFYTDEAYVGVIYEENANKKNLNGKLCIDDFEIAVSGYISGETGIYCCVLTEAESDSLKNGGKISFRH